MAKRADISVLLIFNRTVVRADFAKPLKADALPMFQLAETIDAEANLVDVIESVVEGQPRLAVKTLVLATDVWSQVISLPRISIGGIEADELEAALRFEAETLSGIEIDDLALAYRPVGTVGDFDQFWANVVRQSELEAVNGYLERQGCREITLAHPAGFSNSTNVSKEGLTAEVWDDLVYVLSRNGTQLARLKQASDDPANGCERLLLAGSSRKIPTANRPEETVELAELTDVVHWTALVATAYQDRLELKVAPVLRKSKLRSGTPVRHFLSVLMAISVLGFCLWHWNFMNQTNAALRTEIETVKKPARDKKEFDGQVVAILQDRETIELENEKLESELKRIQFFLENQNDRVAKLLKLLIELRTPDLVIERIDGTEDGLEILGFSINGESAQALAKLLRTEVQSLGWQVNPAKQKGQEKLTTGGPWDFRILLTDVGPSSIRSNERASQPKKIR